MDNKLPDGSSYTVHQGPAELYQKGNLPSWDDHQIGVRMKVVSSPPGLGLDEGLTSHFHKT